MLSVLSEFMKFVDRRLKNYTMVDIVILKWCTFTAGIIFGCCAFKFVRKALFVPSIIIFALSFAYLLIRTFAPEGNCKKFHFKMM